MSDHRTSPPPPRIYGYAPANSVPEYLNALRRPGGDTAACIAALLGVPFEREAQPQPPYPSPPDQSASLVLSSLPPDVAAPTTATISVSANSDAAPLTAPDLPPNHSNEPARRSKLHRPPKSPSRGQRAAPDRARASGSRRTPSLAMHKAHCGICRGEYQVDIDLEFIAWHSVTAIAHDYRIERRALYRHAHATGLFPLRDRNLRMALGHIICGAENVIPTADAVIRAVRTAAQINKSGEWAPPPTRVIVSHGAPLPAQNPRLKAPQLLDTRWEANKRLKP